VKKGLFRNLKRSLTKGTENRNNMQRNKEYDMHMGGL
jgi:hypothetical protein